MVRVRCLVCGVGGQGREREEEAVCGGGLGGKVEASGVWGGCSGGEGGGLWGGGLDPTLLYWPCGLCVPCVGLNGSEPHACHRGGEYTVDHTMGHKFIFMTNKDIYDDNIIFWSNF